jgi:ribonuclease HI
MEALDEQMQGRDVRFAWVKGHAGHDLNEAADERANAAAKAYQAKRNPNRGPGFAMGAAAVRAGSDASTGSATETPAQPLWAEPSSLFDAFDAPGASGIDLHVTLTPDEHARLRDRAEAQGISLEQALRRLI